jgi:hypothetical protein
MDLTFDRSKTPVNTACRSSLRGCALGREAQRLVGDKPSSTSAETSTRSSRLNSSDLLKGPTAPADVLEVSGVGAFSGAHPCVCRTPTEASEFSLGPATGEGRRAGVPTHRPLPHLLAAARTTKGSALHPRAVEPRAPTLRSSYKSAFHSPCLRARAPQQLRASARRRSCATAPWGSGSSSMGTCLRRNWCRRRIAREHGKARLCT